MIDLHSHILPGVDDGAATLSESLEIARAASDDGVEVLAATPHVRADYPTSPETMERLVVQVNEALRAEGVPLEVVPGGELDLERLRTLDESQLRRFGLGGNPGYVLLETPYGGWPLRFLPTVLDLRARAFTPVIAHPERNRDVQESPGLLAPLVEAGALVQLTAASVDGRLGRGACDTAFRLLEAGLVHLLASDAHAAPVRAIGLSSAATAIGDPEVARWLTRAVPQAILDDLPIPERPAYARVPLRRPLLRRLGLSFTSRR